jgi:hypothetical protein
VLQLADEIADCKRCGDGDERPGANLVAAGPDDPRRFRRKMVAVLRCPPGRRRGGLRDAVDRAVRGFRGPRGRGRRLFLGAVYDAVGLVAALPTLSTVARSVAVFMKCSLATVGRAIRFRTPALLALVGPKRCDRREHAAVRRRRSRSPRTMRIPSTAISSIPPEPRKQRPALFALSKGAPGVSLGTTLNRRSEKREATRRTRSVAYPFVVVQRDRLGTAQHHGIDR